MWGLVTPPPSLARVKFYISFIILYVDFIIIYIIHIGLIITDESASLGKDFSLPSSVAATFLAGQSTAQFRITIKDDSHLEEHEYFRVEIDTDMLPEDTIAEGDGEARVYIWDDDGKRCI